MRHTVISLPGNVSLLCVLFSRYFFKTVCDEFESGVVNEEVICDNAVLPLWEGKVVGKVERIY